MTVVNPEEIDRFVIKQNGLNGEEAFCKKQEITSNLDGDHCAGILSGDFYFNSSDTIKILRYRQKEL